MASKIFKFLGISLLLLISTWSFAQQVDEEDLRESAEELFNNEQYQAALPLYSQLLSLNVTSPEYNFRFGACQLFTGENKEKAIQYLKFAAEKANDLPLAHFYYGMGLHLNYRFDKAITQYEKYKENAGKKDREAKLVDYYINQCHSGKTLVSSFTDINVVQREVLPLSDFYRNYDLSEFGGKIIVKPEDFMSEEDQKREAKFLMYFQKDASHIYYASFSPKNETGKDLYFIQKLPTGGWSKPSKLNDVINTDLDEDYPFIHPDGNTLYFASKGHNSMGGYDIFKSVRRGDGSWTQPINMEFAINTPWDDFMFITDKAEKTAWFSSNRETGSTEVTVYKIGIDRIPLDLTLIKGVFETEGSRKTKITIKDEVQNKTIGSYESDGLSGVYLIDLRGSGKYQFIVEAEESDKIHTGTVEVPRQKGLKQFAQEMKLVTIDGVEQLQIINHFDEPLEGESLLTADILKKQASLNVNANEDEIATSEPIASTNNSNAGKSKGQRLTDAQNQLAELKGDAELMKQKANFLLKQAQAKQNSSNQKDIEQSAIAAELASIYNTEAEKREASAKQIASTLELVSNNDLTDDAFNAQLNKATTTIGNFESLESFEEKVPKKMESRLATQVELYDSKTAEVAQLTEDIRSIDDEIAYLQEQLDDTKDKDMKAEYQYQIDDAQAAKPVREAALKRAQEELDLATSAKESADSFMETTRELLGIADNQAETTPGSVSANDINEVKANLSQKVNSSPALLAFVSPKEAPKNDDSTADLADNNQESSTTNQESNTEQEPTNTEETSSVSNVSSETNTLNDNPVDNSSNSDINSEIREIQASESSPEIVQGNYNNFFQQSINEAAQAEDPVVAESRKAELYDQWVENIDFRIDSLNQRLNQDLSTNKKLEISNEIKALETAKQEKEDLAMDSYQAIATLSDQAAANQNDIADNNPVSSNTTSETNSVKPEDTHPEAFEDVAITNINTQYQKELNRAAQLSSPLERKQEEARIQQEWADALQNRIFELEEELANTSSEEKVKLENQLRPVYALKDEKEVKATKLNQQVAAMEQSEATSIDQQELETKLAEYVENYDRSAYEGLYQSININPDENQRLVQTQIMNRSWMMSLRNAIVKTEARARNTDDSQLKAQLNQQLITLEREKLELEARLASSGQTEINDDSALSTATVVKGSELYEGYESVLPEDETTALVEKIESKKSRIESFESELNNLENEFAEAKPKEQEEILENINRKKELIAFEKAELQAYENEQVVLTQLEADLLQMNAGEKTPAEKQSDIAASISADAETFFQAARAELEEAENIKKKSDREPAIIAAEAKLSAARVEKRKAQLATELAEKASEIQELAIQENFIIPRGTAVKLPSVTRTLNPQEQADVKATSEFQSYDQKLVEAATLKAQANQLEQQEIALQNQAQAELTSLSTLSGADRAAQTEIAFKRFDQADSLSAERARKYRQAAFIENEANKDLLTQPEEAYLNILAYYNTTGKPISTPSETGNRADLIADLPSTQEPESFQNANSQNSNDDSNASNTDVATTEESSTADNGATTNTELADNAVSNNTESVDQNAGNNSTNASASNRNDDASNTSEEPFDLLPPTTNNNQERVQVSNDVLTNTIFEIAPNATDNVNNPSNGAATGTGNVTIPLDPVMPAGVVYKIQVGAFSKPLSADRFKGIKPIVGERTSSGFIRYTAGQFPNFVSAEAALDELKSIGFPDAFIVAYRNGVRAPVQETRQYEGKPAGEIPTPALAANGANTPRAATNRPASSVVKRGALQIQDVRSQDQVFYTVQIGVFGRKVTSADVFNITPINEEQLGNGNYRYSSGVYNNFTTADQAKQEIRNIGVNDAFVVAYKNGQRISVAEARQELNDQSGAFTGQPVVSTPVNTTPVSTSTNENTDKYTVYVGSFTGEIPINQATVILSLSSKGIKKKKENGANVYYFGKFDTLAEAESKATELRSQGLTQAKAQIRD